jgi:hypothetical protein
MIDATHAALIDKANALAKGKQPVVTKPDQPRARKPKARKDSHDTKDMEPQHKSHDRGEHFV